MSTRRLHGKVALVTGGAAGIGRATCALFAGQGATVIVGDIDAAGGRETVELVRAENGFAEYRELDVAQDGSWQRVIDASVAQHGTLDVVVNNAGLPCRRTLPDSSLTEWQSLMAVNAGGTFLGLKHGARALGETGGGAIVNVCSAAALIGVPGMITYSASKGAIRAMSRVVAMEYASAGVRVNTVFPSSVRTAMVESDARDTGVTVPQFLEMSAALSPLGRIAQPSDVAQALLFLAGDESSFVTGAELVIDGGATAGIG